MKEKVEGKYLQFKGDVKKKWAKLTDDEVLLLEGQSDKFYGTLKEKHGIEKEEAEKHIKEMKKNCGC